MRTMGTKTADETGATTGAETTTDEEKVNVTKTDAVTESEAEAGVDRAAGDAESPQAEDAEVEDLAAREIEGERPSGVAQGAGAVVSAALGAVSLTGSWVGTIASARESLIGQLGAQSSNSSDIAKLLKDGYGDAWHATALCRRCLRAARAGRRCRGAGPSRVRRPRQAAGSVDQVGLLGAVSRSASSACCWPC